MDQLPDVSSSPRQHIQVLRHCGDACTGGPDPASVAHISKSLQSTARTPSPRARLEIPLPGHHHGHVCSHIRLRSHSCCRNLQGDSEAGPRRGPPRWTVPGGHVCQHPKGRAGHPSPCTAANTATPMLQLSCSLLHAWQIISQRIISAKCERRCIPARSRLHGRFPNRGGTPALAARCRSTHAPMLIVNSRNRTAHMHPDTLQHGRQTASVGLATLIRHVQ